MENNFMEIINYLLHVLKVSLSLLFITPYS